MVLLLTPLRRPERRSPKVEPVVRLKVDHVEEDGRVQHHLRIGGIGENGAEDGRRRRR